MQRQLERWRLPDLFCKTVCCAAPMTCSLAADAFASLQRTQLDSGAQAVLLSSSARGGSATQRQQLRRDKALRDAGVALPADSQLLRKRRRDSAPEQPEATLDSSGDGSASGSESECVGLGVRSLAAATASARADVSLPQQVVGEAAVPLNVRETQADSDSSNADAAPLPSRDLSAAQPPLTVTFGKRKRKAREAAGGVLHAVDGENDANPGAPAGHSAGKAVAAASMQNADARAARDALIAAGDAPGVQWNCDALSVLFLVHPAHNQSVCMPRTAMMSEHALAAT